MACLSKEALQQLNTLPREKVELPELGGHVWVIGMTGAQRDAWEKSLIIRRGKHREVNTENVRAKLVTRCLVDDAGARIFTDGEATTVGSFRVDTLQKLFEVAQRLSGVSDEDVEELGKDSAPEAGSDSPTSSH